MGFRAQALGTKGSVFRDLGPWVWGIEALGFRV